MGNITSNSKKSVGQDSKRSIFSLFDNLGLSSRGKLWQASWRGCYCTYIPFRALTPGYCLFHDIFPSKPTLRYFEAILESQKKRTDFQKEVSRFANKKFRFCYDLFLQPSHVQPKCKGPMNFSKDFVFGVSLMAGDEWIPLQKRWSHEKGNHL